MASYNQPADSPFDPSIPDLDPEGPELEHVLRDIVRTAATRINVCMPAMVHAVHADQTVDIQLLPKMLYTTATSPVDRAVCPNVPVSMPMGANWAITVPVAVGDLGLAIFSDRSIDAFIDSDGSGTYDPQDTRMHDISDAIFQPGLPTSQQQTNEGGDLVVRNGESQVRVKPDGKVQIMNGEQELLSLLDSTLAALGGLANIMATQYQILGLVGPEFPMASSVAALEQFQAQVDQIQENLATLKV
jgi:hypothetical protein